MDQKYVDETDNYQLLKDAKEKQTWVCFSDGFWPYLYFNKVELGHPNLNITGVQHCKV